MKRFSEYIFDDFNLKGKKARIKNDKAKPEIKYKPTSVSELYEIINKKEEEWRENNAANSYSIYIGTEAVPLDLNDIDVSEIKNHSLYYAFENERNLRYIDISHWDVSNITNFDNMFCNCINLRSIGDISDWDVSNSESFREMFNGCQNLEDIGDISNWDVNKLYNMVAMFNGCKKLKNVGDLSRWDVKNIKYLSRAFNNCKKISTLGNLNNWNISNFYQSRLAYVNNHRNYNKPVEQKRKMFISEIRSVLLHTSIKEKNLPSWAKLSNVKNKAEQLIK